MSNSQVSKLDATNSRWLRCVRPRPSARTVLVCFPQAGGAASFFGTWNLTLDGDIELYAVQYPGREDRVLEACIGDMGTLVSSIVDALQPLLHRPLALFGHSMGAGVAYEVARQLEPEPVCLFVSGRHSPAEQLGNGVRFRDDDGVLAELERLGGTPTELLSNPELREMVLPALRSDFALEETYRQLGGQQLSCPIIALVGDDDPDVSPNQLERWKDFTTGSFKLQVFAGDHFYLVSERQRVIDTVVSEIVQVSRRQAW